jgi:hypothetical protein
VVDEADVAGLACRPRGGGLELDRVDVAIARDRERDRQGLDADDIVVLPVDQSQAEELDEGAEHGSVWIAPPELVGHARPRAPGHRLADRDRVERELGALLCDQRAVAAAGGGATFQHQAPAVGPARTAEALGLVDAAAGPGKHGGELADELSVALAPSVAENASRGAQAHAVGDLVGGDRVAQLGPDGRCDESDCRKHSSDRDRCDERADGTGHGNTSRARRCNARATWAYRGV